MSIWDHLFLSGEFPAREDLLSGLTLEQVNLRPTGASHSIFEELWHAATIQRCVVEQDKELEAVLRGGTRYPDAVPEHEQQGQDLVQEFLEGARAAIALAQEPGRLAVEVEPGLTMSEELNCLAVHNAYHLGKVGAAEDRRVAAEGGDGGVVKAGAARPRPTGKLHRPSRCAARR